MDAEDAESLLEWMKEQEEINKDFVKALNEVATLNQSIAEWVEYTLKQQQEIDEIKVVLRAIYQYLDKQPEQSLGLLEAMEDQVPISWAENVMGWLTGDHL